MAIGERVTSLNSILHDFHKKGNNIINIAKNSELCATSDRWNRDEYDGNRTNLINEDDKRDHGSRRQYGPLVSGTAYCISSCSMILLNKTVLSSYNFNAGISLMFYQNLIASVVVIVLGVCGAVSLERLNWKLIKVWIPVNIIFIGMLVSGMYSLKHINIAMVTILKNVTNIFTAIGEFYVFRKRQNGKVWTAMLLMIMSAISGSITDLSLGGLCMENCELCSNGKLFTNVEAGDGESKAIYEMWKS